MKFECSNEVACPVEATVKLIGGKYKIVILYHLIEKTLRYGQLHKIVPRATDKMLSQQLKELEQDGLIGKKVYAVVPPKTEYYLTDLGKSLSPVIYAMRDWGNVYLDKNGVSSCGSEE